MKIYVSKTQYGWQTQAKNGEDKMYLDINFKKGIEPEIVEPDIKFLQIDITDGFFSMYKNKQGLPKLKLVIMEYKKVNKEEGQFEISSEDDLPF